MIHRDHCFCNRPEAAEAVSVPEDLQTDSAAAVSAEAAEDTAAAEGTEAADTEDTAGTAAADTAAVRCGRTVRRACLWAAGERRSWKAR